MYIVETGRGSRMVTTHIYVQYICIYMYCIFQALTRQCSFFVIIFTHQSAKTKQLPGSVNKNALGYFLLVPQGVMGSSVGLLEP